MMWIAMGVGIVALGLAFVFAPKGWRTIAINAVIPVLAGAAEIIPAITSGLPEAWAVYAIGATNLINVVLRKLTTTPLGKSS